MKSYRSSIFLGSNEISINNYPSTIIPSHFGSIRLPIGFPSDPHNHFAAFREYSANLSVELAQKRTCFVGSFDRWKGLRMSKTLKCKMP